MLKIRPILRWGARGASFRRKLLLDRSTAGGDSADAVVPVVFRYGDAIDLRALGAPEYAYDVPARAFGVERLRAGDRLVLGESGGRVVFYAWVMFGQMDMGFGEYVPLSPDRAYTYKLFTVPGARGRRICPAYYAFITRELRSLGYRRLLAWVEAGNRASMRAHRRAGFEVIGCIWHFRFLFHSYPVLRRAVRRSLARPLVPSLA